MLSSDFSVWSLYAPAPTLSHYSSFKMLRGRGCQIWIRFSYVPPLVAGLAGKNGLFFCSLTTDSKLVGWQLCANASLPLASGGISLPPSGPSHLSIRLLKLDPGLHYYLLEAAYSMTPLVRDISSLCSSLGHLCESDKDQNIFGWLLYLL